MWISRTPSRYVFSAVLCACRLTVDCTQTGSRLMLLQLIIFVVATVLILLNLLIAVMTEGYEEVKNDSQARWAHVQFRYVMDVISYTWWASV